MRRGLSDVPTQHAASAAARGLMARLREPKRLPDSYYLVLRRVGRRETTRISITKAEHDSVYEECEDKVRRERRLPAGEWERNLDGIARLGGVWTFGGTVNGDLEPGDGYFDIAEGRLLVNPGIVGLLAFEGTVWNITRTQGGLNLRRRADNARPMSISLEDGVLTVKDLTNIPAKER